MSKDPIHKKKRSYSFHDSMIDSRNQADKSKNKIFQKGHNKFNPYKHRRENWVHKRLRKETHKDRQPPTPHNTTQFIVDAVYYPTDPYIYEYDSNKLEYTFQHHAMAGSMMDLMQQRMNSKMEEEVNSCACDDENKTQDSSFFIPPLRAVKSADDRLNDTYDSDTSDNKDYSHFLNDAKNGKNLGDIIKHLVSEIRKKDDQINSLLSESNRQVAVEEI